MLGWFSTLSATPLVRAAGILGVVHANQQLVPVCSGSLHKSLTLISLALSVPTGGEKSSVAASHAFAAQANQSGGRGHLTNCICFRKYKAGVSCNDDTAKHAN